MKKLKKLPPEQEKLFIDMFHDVYSENRYKYFDTFLDKDHDGFGFGSGYQRFHEGYIEELLESLYFLISGCTFEDYGLFTRDGDPVTENTNKFEVYHALVDAYHNKKESLDIDFFEYMYKREQEISKKNVIPENDIDKKIIHELKSVYSFILPDRLPNNKYQMRDTGNTRTHLRPITKVAVRNLWIDDKKIYKDDRWKITKNKVKDFLIKYIDLDYEDQKIIANIERYIHDAYFEIGNKKSDKIG
jgi:hypothetical protein